MRLKGDAVEWLEPWQSADQLDPRFHENFIRQLALEVSPGHEMHGLRVRLIGRGKGDDSLFGILDGSGRVAVVHLTWSKNQERLPWPITEIFKSIEVFAKERMVPDHREWNEQ